MSEMENEMQRLDEEEEIFDYEQVLDGFRDGLIKLQHHLQEHKAVVGYAKYVEEIQQWLDLYQKWKDEYAKSSQLNSWARMWELIDKKMMGWWC